MQFYIHTWLLEKPLLWLFVNKVMSQLFNMLSSFVIAVPPRSKHLFIFTVWSDFGAQVKKICHCFHFFPFYLPWSDGTGCNDFSFLDRVSSQLFHSPLSLLSRDSLVPLCFQPWVLSSAYLRLLIFLPAMLIPACDSSIPAFHMMYSIYKLNKQGNQKQSWHTAFPVLNQSVVSCPVLTVASWPVYRFLRRQVRWSGIPIFLRISHAYGLAQKFICIFPL